MKNCISKGPSFLLVIAILHCFLDITDFTVYVDLQWSFSLDYTVYIIYSSDGRTWYLRETMDA